MMREHCQLQVLSVNVQKDTCLNMSGFRIVVNSGEIVIWYEATIHMVVKGAVTSLKNHSWL
jgi:hypothetical protein